MKASQQGHQACRVNSAEQVVKSGVAPVASSDSVSAARNSKQGNALRPFAPLLLNVHLDQSEHLPIVVHVSTFWAFQWTPTIGYRSLARWAFVWYCNARYLWQPVHRMHNLKAQSEQKLSRHNKLHSSSSGGNTTLQRNRKMFYESRQSEKIWQAWASFASTATTGATCPRLTLLGRSMCTAVSRKLQVRYVEVTLPRATAMSWNWFARKLTAGIAPIFVKTDSKVKVND